MKLRIAAVSVLAALMGSSGTVGAVEDGCPAGTVDTAPSGGDAYSTFFDEFVVAVGTSATCDLAVDTGAPHAADVFVVYSADYRGFMTLADGETGTLVVTHNGIVDENAYVGLYDDDLLYRNYVASDVGGILSSNITLDITDSADGSSGAALDSIDYALAATTTLGSVQSSIDSLAVGQTAIVTHLGTTADLVTGANEPFERPDSIGVLGALGSYSFAFNGHLNVSDGIALDAGAALFSQSVGGSSATGGLVAGSVRYIVPGSQGFRPYAKFELHAAPAVAMTFSRHYDDGSASGTTAVGTTTGSVFGGYLEAGALFAPTPDDEIVFSGTLIADWLSVSGYSESFGADNLFAAQVAPSSSTFETAKLGVAWTRKLSDDLDATLSAALGHSFAQGAVVSDVAFVGPINSAAKGEGFVRYGVRLGWQINPATKVDAFAYGATGAISGSHVQVGGAVHTSF